MGAVVPAAAPACYRSATQTHSAKYLKVHLWAPAFTGFGGGIAAFSRELALAMRDLGHDVRLYGKADRSGNFSGIPLWGSRTRARFAHSHVFASGVLLAAAARRPEQIISTHVNFGPAADLVSKAFDIPYTLIAHGIDVHPGLPASTLAALRNARRIVAVSSWTRLRVLDLGGIDPETVDVLPNTIDQKRFTPASKSGLLIERYGIRPGERVILTVARLAGDERYKGYDRIVRALPALQKQCGPVRFILVGKGEDAARLETMAGVLGVRRNLTLAGFVPDDELADHYRLADVFAMPSTGEGFGIVFLEALAAGTPVVAGNRDGSVDALDGGRLGCLVDPNDIGQITSAIAAILNREGPPLWFDRDALHDAVVERFGQATFKSRLKDIIRTLTNE
jgi:glycosyltransferase involved in cell wall biosynthesis